MSATASAASPLRAIGVSAVDMTKRFGTFTALDHVSIEVPAGQFHVLLGENGAGKSTLVKCIMGFYQPDEGSLLVDGRKVEVHNPRDARALGIGMVYQQFTLVPSLTGAENLVINRADVPAVIDWRQERRKLASFMERMPFRVPLDVPVASLAAGEKQKLEILKLLYLDQRFLILDEPTSVLTPQEADEVLGLLRGMTERGELTVLMISHKFREVLAFADAVSVLRRGSYVGGGAVKDMTRDVMAGLMIGETVIRERAARVEHVKPKTVIELAGIFADDDAGLPAVDGVSLKVGAGEIVGIAGVSGNGQAALVEVLSGQRPLRDGMILVHDQPFQPVRKDFDRFKVFGLAEEPLRNAAVPRMSVAENIAFRAFDKPPVARLGWWLSPACHAGPGRRAHRALPRQDRIAQCTDRVLVGRQRAAGHPGPGTVGRGRGADRCQSLFRARFRVRGRDPVPAHGPAQPRRRGPAGLGGSRRDPRARRPRGRDVRGQDRLCVAGRRDRPDHHRPAHGRARMIEVPARPYPYALEPGRTALVVIDMQRDFIEPGGFGAALGNDVSRLEAIVPTVGRLLALFRRKGWPVIHTRESHRPDLSDCPPAKRHRGQAAMRIGDEGPMGRILVRGEPGNAIVETCAPVEGEIVLDKPGKGMFCNTDASDILAGLGVSHLVFAGVTTEVCVQTSMREANDRGYECLLVEDATESYFPEFKTMAVEMIVAQGAIVGWATSFDRLAEAVR